MHLQMQKRSTPFFYPGLLDDLLYFPRPSIWIRDITMHGCALEGILCEWTTYSVKVESALTQPLSFGARCTKAYENALAYFPSDLSPSDKALKKQCQEGLEAARNAKKRPVEDTRFEFCTSLQSMADLPIFRAQAMEQELRQTGSNSSVGALAGILVNCLTCMQAWPLLCASKVKITIPVINYHSQRCQETPNGYLINEATKKLCPRA